MKSILPFVLLLCNMLLANAQLPLLIGSWKTESSRETRMAIYTERFFVVSVYNLPEKKFIGTYGGAWKMEKNTLVEVQEFNTVHPEKVGKEIKQRLETKNYKLILTQKGEAVEWTRVDDGKPGALAGAWLITGRLSEGNMQSITPGARKTMKILSGTRFQWIAYNSETKEFFGTGGGTYTTAENKYTENIEFFSRDSNRVGAALEFNYAIEDGNWHHTGLSSKGDPIDEVWTRREKLGL